MATRTSVLPSRYRLLEQIAVGGMGSIWVAEDSVLGRRVAVKILAEQLASQPLFVKRFEREARTAAALSGHPNVITIYDVGQHDGRPFIVMAYLPGGTLRDRIEAGPVARADAVRWLEQAASALDFAHARRVVHRDVKPQNLLFDVDGRLVVADLGIARAAYEDSLTASGELLGTASYISPEQAMGEPATAASDRYSLAIVAYELLTGSRPFGGASFAEQAIQQVESSPEPPSARSPDLSNEVDAVILKGLAKEPADRWPTAGELVARLAEALGSPLPDEPVKPRAAVPPPPPPERPPRPLIDPERTWPREIVQPRSRGRLAAAALALVLVAAAVAGGVLLTSDSDDSGGTGRAGKGTQRAGGKERKRASGDKTDARRRAQAQRPAAPAPAEPSPAPPASTAPVPETSPAALNDQGFRLMSAGRYAEAIPVLQRAVKAFAPDSTDLTYAYALYNLGRSLRLAGRPGEAIPYLERRLRFDNQRPVVRRELAAARAAAG